MPRTPRAKTAGVIGAVQDRLPRFSERRRSTIRSTRFGSRASPAISATSGVSASGIVGGDLVAAGLDQPAQDVARKLGRVGVDRPAIHLGPAAR